LPTPHPALALLDETLALGRDPAERDLFLEPPKSSSPAPAPPSAAGTSPAQRRGIGVLTLGEAAARLGMSRSELETLIDRGAVRALPTGFTRMIPTTEVELNLSTIPTS
jgi:excisionase family DNA binding protein